MWVLMLETHDRVWGLRGPRSRTCTTRYLADARYPVTRQVCAELVALGVARKIPAPAKDDVPAGVLIPKNERRSRHPQQKPNG